MWYLLFLYLNKYIYLLRRSYTYNLHNVVKYKYYFYVHVIIVRRSQIITKLLLPLSRYRVVFICTFLKV